ncbi:N-lysine methyltransferase KMT5A-like [Sinocyclocheilus anshuiensis]|nr:PREDICTED: N-lysine methyltransferase KMT5A-like [Sinocyclocheilus anshuiensis]
MTLDGPPPKRACRQQLCAEHERHCYDRWRSEQLKLREKHIHEHFGCRKPSTSKIEAWIQKRGWTSNNPQASLILRQWKPVGTVDTALDSSFVRSMVTAQRWKGLTIKDVPEKGRGVFTKRRFEQGEVVCEYHGRLVSREEGLAIHASSPDMNPGHLLFYKNKRNEAMCIDAHEESCQCHPLSIIYGRLINHSSKRANIRPRLFIHNDRDVILFITLRDILVNEELRYDYGSKKKSFAGKGVELDWM